MNNFHAIILDMDGTLVDTEKLWKEAEKELLLAYDRQYDPVIHAEFLGLGVADFIEAVQQAYDLTHIDSTTLEQDLENLASQLVAEKTQPTPGAVELIQYITDNAIPCAIASNSSHEIIQVTLSNQRWADGIVKRYSADDVPRAKPAPDLYLHVANQLGTDPQDCLAVEDSLAGLQSAVTAGMTCLAVPDKDLSDVDSFRAITPYVFDTLHEILNFIRQAESI